MNDTAVVNEVQTQSQRSIIPALERLKSSGQPVTVMINGQFSVVVPDDRLFALFLDWVDRCETYATVKQAAEEVQQGRTRPLAEFAAEKRNQHGLPG